MTNDELILQNQPLISLVIKQLNLYWTNEEEYEEIKHAGLIGLIKASRSYTEDKSKFSTYAMVCIKTSILHWVTLKNTDKRKLNYESKASLNKSVKVDSETELIDFVPDKVTNVEKQIEIKDQVDEILEIIKEHTTEENLEIIKMRYGLYGYKPMTLDEIGKIYGVTRNTINQRIKKILRIVRLVLKDKGE